jgi:exoribonuclease R
MRPNTKRSQDDKSEDAKEAPRIVWFKPTDKRVPLIAIPIEQAPEDFVTNTAIYENRLFVVSSQMIYILNGYQRDIDHNNGYIRDPSNAGLLLHFIHLELLNANLVTSMKSVFKHKLS